MAVSACAESARAADQMGTRAAALQHLPRHDYVRCVILYLHGFASGPDSAKGRALAGRFEASGVGLQRADLTPGDGGFERSTPLSMLAEAERLAAAARPRAVMGSSLGGYVAALMSSRGSSSAERLVLLAPAFRLFERWRARLSPGDERAWRERGLEVHHFGSGRTRRLGWRFMEDAATLPAFPEVSVPTLCIAGRRDEIVPLVDVEAFVERTPSARLVVLDDGHDLVASIDRIFEEAREYLGPVLE
jgi:pimeloyl-ACP methyl ester carboxylesterase